MQLAIKVRDPMAEYQDDGIAELTVTCALPVNAQCTKSQTQNHTHVTCPIQQFCSQFYKFHVNSTDLSRFDKFEYCGFVKQCFCMTFHR